jgi:CBS domain containing-hemolysin-like protein
MDNEPKRPKSPTGEPLAYWAIIGTSVLLCFAWLLTGSLMLTLIIIALGMLHLARHFPEAEAFVASDPILLWLRRFSPLIIVCIATLVLVIR